MIEESRESKKPEKAGCDRTSGVFLSMAVRQASSQAEAYCLSA
jgi:hypothetical protein